MNSSVSNLISNAIGQVIWRTMLVSFKRITTKLKRQILICIFLIFSLAVSAQKITDDFTGKWKAPKGAVIIVTKTNEGFIGRTEIENAVVLKEVIYEKGKWSAVVLNPKEKTRAICEITLSSTKLKIVVRNGIFFKTIIWIKYQD